MVTAIGVDIGGTKIYVGLVNHQGRILKRKLVLTNPERGWEKISQAIVRHVHSILPRTPKQREQICGIGIGCPGTISPKKDEIIFAPNLRWRHVKLRKFLAKYLSYPVVLENDTNLGVLGVARFGEARGIKNVVGIFIGTGIGGGIIIDRKLYAGYNGTAGEVGHMIMNINGLACGCGSNGCFETAGSRLAIMRDVEIYFHGRGHGTKGALVFNRMENKGRALQTLCKRGEREVLNIVRNAARSIGQGVSNIINIVNPEMLILGGGVIEDLGTYMMPTIRRVAIRTAIAGAARGIRIVETKLGNNAVMLGGAALAFERFEAA